jgi:hypothetical protein
MMKSKLNHLESKGNYMEKEDYSHSIVAGGFEVTS